MGNIITTKKIKVSRANPLVRIPAEMFNGIDKRRKKIPFIIKTDNLTNQITIMLDYKGLGNNG